MNIIITDSTIELDGQPYKKGSIRVIQDGDNFRLVFPWYNNQDLYNLPYTEITQGVGETPFASAAAFKTFQEENFYEVAGGPVPPGTYELLANKATDFVVLDNTKYPTTLATNTQINSAIAAAIAGSNPTVACQVATNAPLPLSPVYDNGASGVGATLEGGVDGDVSSAFAPYAPSIGDRVLVIDEVNAATNGIYVIDDLGSAFSKYLFTRATDYDDVISINSGGIIAVQTYEGADGTEVNSLWVLSSQVTTIGADPFIFQQYSYGLNIVALNTEGLSQFPTGSTTSAQIAALLTDETGTDKVVFSNAPTLVGPVLGTPASGDLTNCSIPESKVTFSDITTGNASTATHGYLKKLSNVATQYMDGTGTWSVPAGGGGGAVSSVSPTGSSLTISPTTGAVLAQINLANANTWTGAQVFNTSDIVVRGVTIGTGVGNVTGNTALGASALSAGALSGGTNTGVGSSSLSGVTSGSNNTAVGATSGTKFTTGNQNTVVGFESAGGTSGSGMVGSTAVGWRTLKAASGNYNTALGWNVMSQAVSGIANSAFGASSATSISSGTYNTFLGFSAGSLITTGGKNVIVGSFTGVGFTTNSNNVFISDGDGNVKLMGTTAGNVLIGSTTDASTGKLQVTGDLALTTVGNKIKIATGVGASVGVSANMIAGTITVSTTAVTTSSVILVTHNTPGGIVGILSVPQASIVNNFSFVINSSSATDTSTVNWFIIN